MTEMDTARIRDVAEILQKNMPDVIYIPSLLKEQGLGRENINQVFELLSHHGHSYLNIINCITSRTTDWVARWDVVHKKGYCHAAVTVLLVNKIGNVLLQKRGERDSQGKWDASATGHGNVEESDVSAAQRETFEELGLWIPINKFKRFGKTKQYLVYGSPSLRRDYYLSPICMFYGTNKKNLERVSVFVVKIDGIEPQKTQDTLDYIWLSPFEITKYIRENPTLYASSIRQLFAVKTFCKRSVRIISAIQADDSD